MTGNITGASQSISDGSVTYALIIPYKAGGHTDTVQSTISSGVYPKIGETQQAADNPAQPDESKLVETIQSSWFLYIFPAVGIVLIIMAVKTFVRSTRRSGAMNHLMKSGQKVQGIVVNVASSKYGSEVTLAAASPNATIQNYKSNSLVSVRALAMADYRANPITLDVNINLLNSQSYYDDISTIPKITPDRIKYLVQLGRHNSDSSQINLFIQPPIPGSRGL